MKPLLLELENFMAFRKEMLDFSGREVFALTGPTGSGKSTVLDAMIFALFGQTPRMGSQGLRSLITQDVEQPRLKARVTFCFLQNGREYKVIRQIGQGSTSHRVEAWSRLPGETNWMIAYDRHVRDFSKWIGELLGMDYNAFTRVIVLPQGSFDSFLRQDQPKERREMMMRLTRLEIYDQIQKVAQDKALQLSYQLSSLAGQLVQLQHASPEKVAEFTQKVTALEGLYQEVGLQREKLAAEIKLQEHIWELWNKYLQTQSRLQSLEVRQAEFDELERRLAWAQQLIVLDPLLEDHAGLEQEMTEQQRKQTALIKDQSVHQQLDSQLTVRHQNLTTALEARPGMLHRHQQLSALEPEVDRGGELSGKINKDRKQQEDLKRKASEQQALLATTESQLQELHIDRQTLEQEADRYVLNPSREQLLLTHLPELRHLETTLKPEYKRLEQSLAQSKTQRENLAQKHLTAQATTAEAHSVAEQARRRWLDCQEQLRLGEKASLAEVLRHELHVNQPCPVCSQTVGVVPEFEASPALDFLQAACEEAQQQLKQAETNFKRQEKTQMQLESQIESQAREIESQQNNLRTARSRLQESETQLMQAMGSTDLQLLSQELQQLQQARQAIESILQKKQGLQKREQELLIQRERANEARTGYLNQLEDIEARVLDVESELQTIVEKLKQALGVDSDFTRTLKAEQEKLTEQLEAWANEEQQLTEALRQSELDKVRLETLASELQVAAQKLDERQQHHQQRLDSLLQELDLPDLPAAISARVNQETRGQWKQQLETYRQDYEQLRRELQQLQTDLDGREVSEAQLITSRTDFQAVNQNWETTQQELAVARHQLLQAEQELAEAGDLLSTKQTLEHEKKLYTQIEEDLKSNHLPNFVYHRILERVIEQGNHELWKLSQERYSFAIVDEDLMILDAWNANQPRPLKTLSGGESFMASLALALALNEYLAAGTQLGSLFIDEGFGTLDPESLEQAAEAIEKLQARGKCIGVITHIPELAERFESRIRVSKSDQGATLELV